MPSITAEPRIRGWAAAAFAVLAAVACARDASRPPAADASASPDEYLAQLRAHKDRIDHATDELVRTIETYNATRRPGERTIEFSDLFSDNLTDAQRDVINRMVGEEKDVSYRALLQKIVADRDTIRDLQDKVARLEQSLTDRFVVARQGDKHHDLAMSFLVNEAQVEPGRAESLIAAGDQTDELLPGNKVWFHYDAGQDAFRTYVTQGEAGMTPVMVRRAQQRALLAERDAARTEVADLQGVKAGLESDVAALREDKTTLLSSLAQTSSDLAFQRNSLFYHAAHIRDLRSRGVVSRLLRRVQVKDVTFETALDLREGSTIVLDPRQFGVRRIARVRLLPRMFKEGRDFRVESDPSGSARIVILDAEPFKGKEILLAVSG